MTEITTPANGVARNPANANGKASYADKHKLADHFIGGNRLENAAPSKVKDFVAEHDGHTVITNVSSGRLAGVRYVPQEQESNNWLARSSSPTMVLRPSRKSDLCGSGRTRLLATRRPSTSPSWPRQRILRPMPTTFGWRTTTWKYRAALITTTMQTSS